MKKRFIRNRALFLVFLIISSTISFSYLVKTAQAQEVQQNNIGCCEKTKSGEFCAETSEDNCDRSNGLLYDPNSKCEEASFCAEGRLTCCFYEESGACTPRTLDRECQNSGGTALGSGSCEEISECKSGCSIIGSQCDLRTQKEHDLLVGDFSEASAEFRADVNDELECRNVCSNQYDGCCVSADGTYSVTIESECQGTFHKNELCSSLENSPCSSHAGSGCYDGKLYWEDSCGNKEDVKEECNYNEGKFCKDREEINTAECVDVNCQESYSDEINVHDPELGNFRNNGESWCIYEGPTGAFLDRPGSRHYKHACLNGEEIAESCRDFREEVCLQSNENSGTDNPLGGIPVDQLIAYGSNLPLGTLNTLNSYFSQFSLFLDAPLQLKNGFNQASCEYNEIYDGKITQQTSSVDKGFAFWEFSGVDSLNNIIALSGLGNQFGGAGGQISTALQQQRAQVPREDLPRTESSKDGGEICAQGSLPPIKVKWKVCPLEPPMCIKNCFAEKQDFIDKSADYCRSLGDCGVDFNVLGVQSPIGLPAFGGISFGRGYPPSFTVIWRGDAPGDRPTQVSAFKLIQWATAKGVWKGMKQLSIIFSDIQKQIITSLGGTGGGGAGFLGTGSLVQATAVIYTGSIVGGQLGIFLLVGGWNPLFLIVDVIILATIIILGQCEFPTKTVTVSCNPWQAPVGGSDCDACRDSVKFETLKNVDENSFNSCTEYKCKSLGSACEFIAETADGSDCIDSNPNDASPPGISPQREILENEQHLDIEDLGRNGFNIKNILPAFKPVKLAVKTDELANCAYTNDGSEAVKPFEEYPHKITEKFAREHIIDIKYPPSDPREIKETSYYIKCQDTHGLANEAAYTVNIKVNNEPDLEYPLITINGPSYIRNGETTVYVTLAVDDANPIECKYDKENVLYNNMKNEFSCEEERSENGNFICDATLIDLHVGENIFYFLCRDMIDDDHDGNIEKQNTMIDAKEYKVAGTEPLEVFVLPDSPSGTIFYDDITLHVQTQKGAEQGKSVCEYSLNNGPLIKFKNTDSTDHIQSQTDLQKGHYTYGVKCHDIAQNEAPITIEFDVSADTDIPDLLNVYKQSGLLYIILNEATTCEANNQDFAFGDGIKMSDDGETLHSLPLQFSKYIIKCIDNFNNPLKTITVIP